MFTLKYLVSSAECGCKPFRTGKPRRICSGASHKEFPKYLLMILRKTSGKSFTFPGIAPAKNMPDKLFLVIGGKFKIVMTIGMMFCFVVVQKHAASHEMEI